MNLITRILFFVLTIFLNTISFAQVSFEKAYGGIDFDRGKSVQQTLDGGYAIVGITRSYGAGSSDFYLIKTDSLGNETWMKTFGGEDIDTGNSFRQTSDGGYIIVGSTRSFGVGNYDVYLIKTDAAGDTIWTKTYGGPGNDYGTSVQQTADGSYIIAGSTSSFGLGSYDTYFIKTDSNGDSLWTKTYGGIDNDQALSVCNTSDRGFIASGLTRSFGTGDFDIYIIRADSSGDTLWTRTYGDTSGEQGYSIQQTRDGGYIVTGNIVRPNGFYDFYLVKTNNSGDTLWTRTYGGSLDDAASFVRQTTDDGFILTGYTDSFGAGGSDIYVVRVNASGDTLWTRTYGDSLSDSGYMVRQTTDGGYIITGQVEMDSLSGNVNVYLIKINEPATASNMSDQLSPSPKRFSLVQNYPNPFNPVTKIKYAIAGRQFVSLKVYDLLGKEITTLLNEEKSGGEYILEFDARELSSGIYFYQLKAGDFTQTKKMILIR